MQATQHFKRDIGQKRQRDLLTSMEVEGSKILEAGFGFESLDGEEVAESSPVRRVVSAFGEL